MDIKLLDNTADIEKEFIDNFVMPWEEFQIKQKKWIDDMAKNNYSIDIKWYEQAYMWDRIDPKFPRVCMNEALDFLREHTGAVLFLSEKGEDTFYQGRKIIDFIAEADALILAEQIEKEWLASYELTECDTAFLPEDLYVFDLSMKWCVVFTHEGFDLEVDDPIKAAESRFCIICKL